MKTVIAYLKLLRINNALIAATTVAIGFWLSQSTYGIWMLALLMIATIAATGFVQKVIFQYTQQKFSV